MNDHPLVWLAFAGLGGFGLGIGLVLGAFVARALRHYMRDEGLGGRNGNGKTKRD